ncbi:MAG: hypothetical protein KAW02_05940, partial [candidate division Zixibacteria bacterium]|nr:hypothetical protein [candidate division Zixibacteria bacterium]
MKKIGDSVKGKFALNGQRIKRMERMFKKIVKWQTIQRARLFKLSLVTVTLFFLSCTEMPVVQQEVFYPQIKQPAVTIKLLKTKNSLTVSSNGSYLIRCFPREGEPSIYYASAEMLMKLSDGGISLSQKTQGELETNLHKVSFSPKDDDVWVYLNGKPYRGLLEITTSKNPGSLLVLNLIFVED